MDSVLHAFLESALAEATSLAQGSDVLQLTPLPVAPWLPPSRYLCRFDVPFLRRTAGGTVQTAAGPVVAGLHFPEDYLRSTDPRLPLRVVTLLGPLDIVHPNLFGQTVCLGSQFAPGTPITALLWELYDILSYQNVALDERNALNPEASRLLREHPEMVARLHPGPFLRRRHKLQIRVSA